MAVQKAVLRRKVAASRPAESPVETGARAWRVAFARAARDCIGLDLAVPVLRDDRRSLGELLDLLPDRALLAVLEGPGQGLGLVALSPEVLASVIEQQTIGRVVQTPPLPRRPTRTDAAMCVRLVDAALSALETALATSPDLTWTAGFRYASFLEEARPVGLLLEDVPFRVLACDVDMAGGARTGRVLLALPAEGRGPRPAPAPAGAESAVTAQAWKASLDAAVLGAEIVLDAVIARMRLPLSQAMALQPGAILPLNGRLDSVALVAPGGETIGSGKLGQHRGARALKLRSLADVAPPPSVQTQPLSLPTDPDAAAAPPLARSA